MCVCVYVCMCEARVCVSVCVRERVAGGGSSAALLAYARGDHGVSRAQTSTSLCFLAAYAAFLFICWKILFMSTRLVFLYAHAAVLAFLVRRNVTVRAGVGLLM